MAVWSTKLFPESRKPLELTRVCSSGGFLVLAQELRTEVQCEYKARPVALYRLCCQTIDPKERMQEKGYLTKQISPSRQ